MNFVSLMVSLLLHSPYDSGLSARQQKFCAQEFLAHEQAQKVGKVFDGSFFSPGTGGDTVDLHGQLLQLSVTKQKRTNKPMLTLVSLSAEDGRILQKIGDIDTKSFRLEIPHKAEHPQLFMHQGDVYASFFVWENFVSRWKKRRLVLALLDLTYDKASAQVVLKNASFCPVDFEDHPDMLEGDHQRLPQFSSSDERDLAVTSATDSRLSFTIHKNELSKLHSQISCQLALKATRREQNNSVKEGWGGLLTPPDSPEAEKCPEPVAWGGGVNHLIRSPTSLAASHALAGEPVRQVAHTKADAARAKRINAEVGRILKDGEIIAKASCGFANQGLRTSQFEIHRNRHKELSDVVFRQAAINMAKRPCSISEPCYRYKNSRQDLSNPRQSRTAGDVVRVGVDAALQAGLVIVIRSNDTIVTAFLKDTGLAELIHYLERQRTADLMLPQHVSANVFSRR